MSDNNHILIMGKIEEEFIHPKKYVMKQSSNSNKRDRVNGISNNIHVGRFIYPIANCSFNSKSSVNLIYRMRFPEKPPDQSKLINFISNKGLKHSYSSNHFFGYNEDPTEQKTTSILSLNNTFGSSKHFESSILKPIKSYSNDERNYFKNNLKNEMRHRSLMIGRLPPIRKKIFHQIINECDREREIIENDQYVCQEKSNLRIRKRYQKMIPQIKIMEQNILKWRKNNKNNIDKHIEINPNNKRKHINPNTRFLKQRDSSNIKMTASYVRDLKIIAAVKKIQDPNLAIELKRKINGKNELTFFKN